MSDTYAVRRPVIPLTLVYLTNNTTITSSNYTFNGQLDMFKVKTGAVNGAATITLNIIDADGDTVYTKSGMTGGTTVVTDLEDTVGQIPLSGTYTVQLVYSVAQTANNSAVVTLYIDEM